MAETVERTHTYHAEASALSGYMQLPLEQDITPHALANVPEEGGYRAQQASEYRLETIISYGRAHTQVSGHKEIKPGRGWNTLTTTVVENVNILNVITADRVVAQIGTEHPLKGYVPHITFLGTHFENLKIAGHPIDVCLDLEIVGPKPENDFSYTHDAGFIDRISKQHARLREHPNVLAEILERYNRVPESFGKPGEDTESVEFSLVEEITDKHPEHICRHKHPGHRYGHVIYIPDFGTITLAKVRIEHKDLCAEGKTHKTTTVQLDMIHAKMGCIATGDATFASSKTNGKTIP